MSESCRTKATDMRDLAPRLAGKQQEHRGRRAPPLTEQGGRDPHPYHPGAPWEVALPGTTQKEDGLQFDGQTKGPLDAVAVARGPSLP